MSSDEIRRQSSIRRLTALDAVVIAALLSVAAISATAILFHQRSVNGVARADASAVAEVAAERKQADAAAFLNDLEQQVLAGLKNEFADPAGRLSAMHLTLSGVSLVNVGPNVYDGMLTIAAPGGPERFIKFKVTADDRNIMWTFPPDALEPVKDDLTSPSQARVADWPGEDCNTFHSTSFDEAGSLLTCNPTMTGDHRLIWMYGGPG